MTDSIALTLGDPCGIGPELWVSILCDELSHGLLSAASSTRLELFGDPGVLLRAAQMLGRAPEWDAVTTRLRLHPITSLAVADARPGCPTHASAAAQLAYVQAAIEAAQRHTVQGVCTAPIHKAAAKTVGFPFPGQTEWFAACLPQEKQAVMMLAGPSLRVALATTHVGLAQVSSLLHIDSLADVIYTTALALHTDFAVAAPRVALCALNPHAGEEGHFGDEESRVIAPAMAAAMRRLETAWPGLTVSLSGPHVPDVIFRQVATAPPALRPDAVVAMYHDQGLIPLKLLDFDQAVNVTLGLSVPRTSPDHGVAYDLAGRGTARSTSQRQALSLCVKVASHRRARYSAPTCR